MSETFGPPETGFVKDLAASVYHGTEGYASSHGLMKILKSPAHYKAGLLEDKDREPTPAMRMGSILHSAILEPALFLKRKVVQPDFGDMRSSKNREARDLWKLDLPEGSILISEQEADQIVAMLDVIQKHPIVSKLFQEGASEVSGFWTDERTGLRCRIRPDYLREDGLVIDYKTTTDASFKAFQRDAYRYMYHLQAAFYLEGVSQIRGKKSENFIFVVQEKEEPYAVAVYVADEAFLEKGKDLACRGLDIYKHCLATDQWPGYPEMAINLSLPNWAFYEEE